MASNDQRRKLLRRFLVWINRVVRHSTAVIIGFIGSGLIALPAWIRPFLDARYANALDAATSRIAQPVTYTHIAIVFFGACILYASFLAWDEERTEVEAANDRIRELEIEKPEFLTSLACSLGSFDEHVEVLTDLTARNKGNKASILRKWNFKYSNLVGGEEHFILHMPVNIAFTPSGIKQMGEPISTDSGVPPGGERTYRRSYPIGFSMDEIAKNGLRVTISFTDIDDLPYSAIAEFAPRQKIS